MLADTSVAVSSVMASTAIVSRDDGGDRVLPRDRRRGRRAQVGDVDGRRGRARVLEQVEQVEGAVGGALGEEPRRRRRGHRRLGMAAVAAAPRHRPVDDDRRARLDDGRERRRAGESGLERTLPARMDLQRHRRRGAVVALIPHDDWHGRRRRVGDRDGRAEEAVRRTFREVADAGAERMAAALELGEAGGAVAVGIGCGIGRERRIEAEERFPVARQAVGVGIEVAHEDVAATGRRVFDRVDDVSAVRAEVAGEWQRAPVARRDDLVEGRDGVCDADLAEDHRALGVLAVRVAPPVPRRDADAGEVPDDAAERAVVDPVPRVEAGRDRDDARDGAHVHEHARPVGGHADRRRRRADGDRNRRVGWVLDRNARGDRRHRHPPRGAGQAIDHERPLAGRRGALTGRPYRARC